MLVIDEKMMFRLRGDPRSFILHGSSMGYTGSIDWYIQGDRNRDDH